jgi:hypothetical protein
MYISSRILLPVLLLLLGSFRLLAQDDTEGNLKERSQKELEVNGGLMANLITNTGDLESNRLPFAWNINGNLSLNISDGLEIPVSMNISNLNSGLQVPNTPTRISLSPKYKAFTVHMGDLNLNYSPYTLNSHQFVGGGLDIAPQKSRFSFRAMGGKFQRSVAYDSINSNNIAAYERWGYGGKIKYAAKDYHIAINLFTATDKLESLAMPADFIGVRPQQNLTSSIDASLRPFKGMEVKAEVALSVLTSDIRDSAESVQRLGFPIPFFTENNSTGVYNANSIAINYNAGKNRLGLSYEKIDPEYRTLGAYFFTNDLENITLSLGRSLFRNKMSFFGRAGIQRDNIDNAKPEQNQRIVGAVNVNYSPNYRLQIAANYSNFTTIMRVQSQFQFVNQANQFQALDTFNFSQVSQNLNINSNYMLVTKDSSMQFLNVNFSLQDVTAEQFGQELLASASLFYNLSLSHIIQNTKRGLDIVTSYLATSNQLGGTAFLTHGPSLSVTKRVYQNKIKLQAGVNYNLTTSADVADLNEDVLNLRLGVNYRINKTNSLIISVVNQSINGLNTQIGNVSYHYIF